MFYPTPQLSVYFALKRAPDQESAALFSSGTPDLWWEVCGLTALRAEGTIKAVENGKGGGRLNSGTNLYGPAVERIFFAGKPAQEGVRT